MMEDTVVSGLMDESAPVCADLLSAAIKQNNITSDLSILEG